MTIINAEKITKSIAEMLDEILCNMDEKLQCMLERAADVETSHTAKFALDVLTANARLAREKHIALCQDTGMVIVFVHIGDEVFINGNLNDAVNEGVRQAYKDGYRKSILTPLDRVNTGDNTPAVIHVEYVHGKNIELSVMAKGFGSENMSRVYMLTPADGIDGIINSVIETVKDAGGCPCPPVIIGIGIGGTMEKAAICSKRALLRELGSSNIDCTLDKLEKQILCELNKLDIGAFGRGGVTTALAVFAESYPTHIAGLPLAITVQCHCSRHGTIVIKG